MKYHFKVVRLDDGRFLARSVELYCCSERFDRLEDAAVYAYRTLHEHLSVPPIESIFASALRGSLKEIKAQFIFGAIDVIAVPVEPATALALTLRR